MLEKCFQTLEHSFLMPGNDFPTLELGFPALEPDFQTQGKEFQMLGNLSQTFGERFKTPEVLIHAFGNGGAGERTQSLPLPVLTIRHSHFRIGSGGAEEPGRYRSRF